MFPFKNSAATTAASAIRPMMPFQPGGMNMPLFSGGMGLPNFAQGLMPAQNLATQAVSQPSQLMGMIGHLQKAIQTANRVVPMVQQYGPMVRNIPSMFKMMKAFKTINATDSSENADTATNAEAKDTEAEKSNDKGKMGTSSKEPKATNSQSHGAKKSVKINSSHTTKSTRNSSDTYKQSKPKMYV